MLLAFAGGLALGACTKNDNNTIVPIGTEDIKDIHEVIPDSLYAEFDSVFGGIPQGFVPPKIEGSYVMAPKHRVASNMPVSDWPLDQEESNMYLRFTKQHNGIAQIELKEISDPVTIYPVFVCGNGNDNSFAVYFEEKIEVLNIKMTRAVIMKGKVSEAGLVDFQFATITKESDGGGQLPGSFFIYKDGNGLAERYDW